jgi:predicted amidophosphoribosyltransferase
MRVVACNKCHMIMENIDPGKYFCKNCGTEMDFFQIQAFCGAKPNQLNENPD